MVQVGVNGKNGHIRLNGLDNRPLHIGFSRDAFESFEDDGMMRHNQVGTLLDGFFHHGFRAV